MIDSIFFRWLGIAMMVLIPIKMVHASQLTIEITQGLQKTIPIAVPDFVWATQASVPQEIAQVIGGDLRRSGQFLVSDTQGVAAITYFNSPIDYAKWRSLGLDYLLSGEISQLSPKRYQIQVKLFNLLSKTRLIELSYQVGQQGFRRLAHQISDQVYEQLTGKPGAFNTQIAYVSASVEGADQPMYRLYIADSDGYNPQAIVTSKEPLMSPSWSPDGKRLAYVSFEKRRSQIFIQDLRAGQREQVSRFQGINGAPAWSPDGRQLALTLSRDGQPDIYLLDLASKNLRRLTKNLAIDTEPSWSPDGQHILFTSDRGGQPQLYQLALSDQQLTRLTYQGDYNVRGVYSPDGKSIAMVHLSKRRYRIALMDVDTQELTLLSNGPLDESPSFSPNGAMVLYATTQAGVGVLSAVSVDGKYRQRLASSQGDVRDPAWSPFYTE